MNVNQLKVSAKAKCIHNWDGYNRQYHILEGIEVTGFYYKDVIDNEDSGSFIDVHYIRIEYGDHYGDIEIDPETIVSELEKENDELKESILKDLKHICYLIQGTDEDIISKELYTLLKKYTKENQSDE